MKISEFVAVLEEIKATEGDLPVATGSMMGGYYEPSPEVEEVKLDVRVGKNRIEERLTLCVVIG